MKKILLKLLYGSTVTILIVYMSVLLSAMTISWRSSMAVNDLWQQLGISEEDAARNIKYSFISNFLDIRDVRNLNKITLNDRVAIAKELLKYTRQYVESKAFKEEYLALRNNSEPNKPYRGEVAPTEQELRAEYSADAKKRLGWFEEAVKNATTPEDKKTQQDYADNMSKRLKDLESPNSEEIKRTQDRIAEYKLKLQRWKEQYPENELLVMKKALGRMLAETEGIDYNAAIVVKRGIKYFTNPDYEKKSIYWKYGFRAGKEVTETSRAFAREWMKDIK
jgi:hypothetical protein